MNMRRIVLLSGLLVIWVNTCHSQSIGIRGFEISWAHFNENVYFTSGKTIPVQIMIINRNHDSLDVNNIIGSLKVARFVSFPSKDFGGITDPDDDHPNDLLSQFQPRVIKIMGSKEKREAKKIQGPRSETGFDASMRGEGVGKYSPKIPDTLLPDQTIELFAEIGFGDALPDGFYGLCLNASTNTFHFSIRNVRDADDLAIHLKQQADAYAYSWWDKEKDALLFIDRALSQANDSGLSYQWAAADAESRFDYLKAKSLLLEGIKRFPDPLCCKKVESWEEDIVVKPRELKNGVMCYDKQKPELEKHLLYLSDKVNFRLKDLPSDIKKKFNKGLNVPESQMKRYF